MDKIYIKFIQIIIIVSLIFMWEYLSNKNIINSFVFSSPSKITRCISDLYKNNNLINHIIVTLNETLVSFILSIIISFAISIILYEFQIIFKIFEPFFTALNSMPKVALGPLFIILFGAGKTSIIVMALSITLIINILTIYNSFLSANKYLIKLLKSLKSSRLDKLKYLVIPSAYKTIINSLKINISMTLIGVIMGEFLVSKAGIGYLIIYGTQVFNLTLVMSGIVILMIISFFLYLLINYLEKKLNKKYLT